MATFPLSNGSLSLFMENYKNKLPEVGAKLNLSAAAIREEQKHAGDLIASIQFVDQKKNEYLSAANATREVKRAKKTQVRNSIRRMMTLPGWTEALGQTLGVAPGSASPVSMDTYKPVVQVTSNSGLVKIRFTRHPVEGLNLYSRLRGETDWKLLGRITASPFTDSRPPLTPGGLEVRQYRAIGVVKDREVGLWSDVAVVTIGE